MTMPATVPVEHIFTLEARLDEVPTFLVKDGPRGARLLATVAAGTFSGARLSGSLGPEASGDWVTIRPSGIWDLDVRAALHTDDGANILFTYTGIGVPDEGRMRIRGAPRFEAGDDRYRWLNDLQAVLLGEADPRTHVVRYDVFALT
jgi:hypothetical protein